MPIVYACICPTSLAPDAPRVADALGGVAEELAGYRPETVLVVASTSMPRSKIGVFAPGDNELGALLLAEANKSALQVETLMRFDGADPSVLPDGVAPFYITASSLDSRTHFEFGRAAARAIGSLERRIAIVCAVELSKANAQFDQHYRRAISSWDVKALVNMDADLRRRAGERAVAQTAVLMGTLSSYRIQPRELAYEAGQVVAAIDVLGPRRGTK